MNYEVRLLQPEDSKSLTELLHNSPDSGRFAIAAKYQTNPYRVLTASGHNYGFVAVQNGNLCGLGMVDIRIRQCGDFSRTCALLNTLVVHPNYRRQGIGTALVNHRIAFAHAQDDAVVIIANVQQGNAGSEAIVHQWQQDTAVTIRSCLVKTRQMPPSATGEVTVRHVDPAEYSTFATRQNAFYQDYLLYRPATNADMTNALKDPISDKSPLQSYYAAVSADGRFLAGLSTYEQHQLVQMQVVAMPAPIRLLNQLVQMLPQDGCIKQAKVDGFWYLPGEEAAARHLWESVRWQLAKSSTHITFSYDIRGPFPEILQLPWWLPQGRILMAFSELQSWKDRLLYPI